MKITGAGADYFTGDNNEEASPIISAHPSKPSDGSINIGNNYVHESASNYIVNGCKNSVGAGCSNISILNSSGCIVAPGVTHASIVNSSGVIVYKDHAAVVNSSGITISETFAVYQNSAKVDSLSTAGKRIYRGIMNQNGTASPSVIVLENSIGTIIWSRVDAGLYSGLLTSAFKLNKTFIVFGSGDTRNFIQDNPTPMFYRESDNTVRLDCSADNIISNVSFEITTYI